MPPQKTGGATLVVRLTKKLAERIDGISLSEYLVGDLIHLDQREAEILLAEGWAEIVAEEMYIIGVSAERRVAADRSSSARQAAGRRRRKTDTQDPVTDRSRK